MLPSLPGCYQRVVHDPWEDLRKMASEQPQGPQPTTPTTAPLTHPTDAPPPENPSASLNASSPAAPYDLHPHTGNYTLQIGFYDEEFGPDYRQAAEQAVVTLRQQGEEAYFYHGPFRSMITLGLFTDADFVQRGPVSAYGPRIEALQQKFPYNLANGCTLVQKIDGQDIGQQESFLVRVP